MEKLPNLEKREKVIDELIEKLAEQEGMSFEDILGFMVGFAEIYMEDEDVKPYFEEVAEKIEISFEEIMEYAKKKLENNKNMLE